MQSVEERATRRGERVTTGAGQWLPNHLRPNLLKFDASSGPLEMRTMQTYIAHE